MRNTQKKNRHPELYAVKDDYGLTSGGSQVRVASRNPVSRESSGGVRYTRPEPKIQRRSRVYPGREIMTRSREITFGDNRKPQPPRQQHSSRGHWRDEPRKAERKPLVHSREIKVKVRQGHSHSRSREVPGNVVSTLGHYLEKNVPREEQRPIRGETSLQRKVNIQGMLESTKPVFGRAKSRELVQSIQRGRTSRMATRSGSSLKHEIKVRSISRSRNLVNLDEYCTKIERESRYLSGSIQNDQQSRKQQSKMETLVSSLRKIQKKREASPMNNDYYALGGPAKVRVSRPQPRREERPDELTAEGLRWICQMYPFNQPNFWDMTTHKQEQQIRKFNPQLVQKLGLPVRQLISKVRQSKGSSGARIFQEKRLAQGERLRGNKPYVGERERPKGRPRCKLIGQNRKFNLDDGDDNAGGVEYVEDPKFSPFSRPREVIIVNALEEVKNAPIGGGQKNFEEDDFSGFDFDKRRQKRGFKDVGFKDRRHYESETKGGRPPVEREVGGGRPPVSGVQRGRALGGPAPGSWAREQGSADKRSRRGQPRSQVRIRNKRRNFGNQEFVTVNRKTVEENGSRRKVGVQAVRRVRVGGAPPNQSSHGHQGQYYSQRHVHSGAKKGEESRKIYLDRLNIQNENESEDFDDDYFEERERPLRAEVHKQVARTGTGGAARAGVSKPKIIAKRVSDEQVFVDRIDIPKDSQDEEIDDDYFEERGAPVRHKQATRVVRNRALPKGAAKREAAENRKPPAPRERVYVEKIEIQADSQEEDYGDEYFEERDPRDWKDTPKVRVGTGRKRAAGQQNFREAPKQGGRSRNSGDVVYMEQVVIPKDSGESEDYGDDYFEERDSWNHRQQGNREQPKRGENPGVKNVFYASQKSSKVAAKHQPGFSGISKINPDSSRANSGSNFSSQFKSFAMKSKGDSRGTGSQGWRPETQHVQIESKNEMSPDPKITSRETKGPDDYQMGVSEHLRSGEKTHRTLSTRHNTERKRGKERDRAGDFKDPYSAQIFTDEKTYVVNNSRVDRVGNQSRHPGSSKGNTFTDYYRTQR